MKELAKQTYLTKRKGIYYFRRRVPPDLVAEFGKSEFFVSLGTRDLREAITLAHEKAYLTSRQIDQARARLNRPGPRELSDHDLRAVVDRWFADALVALDGRSEAVWTEDDFEENRWLINLLSSNSPSELDGALNNLALETLRKYAGDKVDLPKPEAFHGALPETAANASIRWPFHPNNYQVFTRLLQRAWLEIERRDAANHLGDYSYLAHDTLFEPKAVEERLSDSLTLEALIEDFLSRPLYRRQSEKYKREYNACCRVMVSVIGNLKPVSKIDRADCRRFVDVILELPANHTKRFPDMNLEHVLENSRSQGLKPMSNGTAREYVRKMNSIFKWAVLEELMDKSPAEGLRAEVSVKSTEKTRLPFTSQQLKRIFSDPTFTSDLESERGARFWIPLIGLFSGMRLNEICQLRISDLETIDEIDVFQVRADSSTGQKTKTVGSNRTIPIHPKIKQQGFGAYVERIRLAGEEQLFPELRRDRRGYYSDALGDWFNRTLLPNVEAKTSKNTFHSFRHSFNDGMREAKIPYSIMSQLGGWSSGNIQDGYGAGVSTRTLYEELSKVNFEGFPL